MPSWYQILLVAFGFWQNMVTFSKKILEMFPLKLEGFELTTKTFYVDKNV